MSKKLKVGSKVRIPRAPEFDYENKGWIVFDTSSLASHFPCVTRDECRQDMSSPVDRYARVDKYTPKFIFATVAH